jgi:hypothetical protein
MSNQILHLQEEWFMKEWIAKQVVSVEELLLHLFMQHNSTRNKMWLWQVVLDLTRLDALTTKLDKSLVLSVIYHVLF